MTFLLILSGVLLGSFLTGVVALILHLNHEAELRAYFKRRISNAEARARSIAWAECSAAHREHKAGLIHTISQ